MGPMQTNFKNLVLKQIVKLEYAAIDHTPHLISKFINIIFKSPNQSVFIHINTEKYLKYSE